ncbi:hypothetical protein DPM19_23525 [Actinomadura craniellae]|uniref:Uncharacterized protein n=1 Tax=Actinomadura craniellae TaxID=2231787 RepID=A0A365H0L1_9ACTN|nr:hypothetical protein [Actinomadura craniellae]RAY12576.1 hypothetical protein DPM19_23525 [Actinomadura craniellae]
MSANAYSFLPWLRTGIATKITADPGTADRASITVTLRLTGEAIAGGQLPPRDVEQQVQIYGPGDVIGVDPRAISRTEPAPWVTNVEPNYLAHLEFYDEDFPWRYSPAVPDGTTRRLAPWLALVVLAAGEGPDGAGAEFTEGVLPDRPLPFIAVTDPAATLPPADQLGAWAHVHVNGGLDAAVATDDLSAALPNLDGVLRHNADNACSRLMCPRRLDPDTGYHAFLVPAFETGRLAGLGLDPAGSPGALFPAWGATYQGQQAAGTLPYYHRWFFGTGGAGDFEYLVRLLEPRIPDPRVGRRDVDVHRSPGLGLPGINTPDAIGGVLRLGGALQVPKRPADAFDTWDTPYPHPFQQALSGLINLADDYTGQQPAAAHAALAATDPAARAAVPQAAEGDQVDPVITPPLYGRWHALTSRLLSERDGTPIPAPLDRNWVHRLNLDPRFRVAAGFGVRVVQRRQEEFMAAAWAQIGDVLALNGRIRAAQLAREVGHALQARHLEPPATTARLAAFPSGKSLTLTAPAHSRVTVSASSGPGQGLLAGLAGTVAVGHRVATSQVAAAPLSPAMRRIVRPGARLMRSLEFPAGSPPEALVSRMDAESGPVTAAPPKTVPDAVVTPEQLDEVLHPPGPGLAAAGDPVGELPTSSDFVLTLPGDPFVPTPGGPDSPEAQQFKAALRDLYQGRDAAAVGGRADARDRLLVDEAATAVLQGLRADRTVPQAMLDAVNLPQRVRSFAERFIEAMAYPVIDLPMYRALLEDSVDVFVPNLTLIPPNTITLLETNQEFIESYLVGLNHELARELLWREYPTDQRGTPFRQFWDSRTALSPPGETAEQRRERLYDIRPIHRWPPESGLGENDNREEGGAQEDDLVLVIRGDLLKKYPNAAIYAHRARWQPDNAHPDPDQERVPVDLVDPEHPTLAEIRLPLYEAKVDPDIHLLGFDLTAAEAEGENGDAGWFFVIKERPGDPRFGLDVGPSTRVEVWNDLSWPDVDPAGHGFIRLDANTAPVPLQEFDDPIDDQEKREQHLEDLSLPVWFAGLSAADIAYMLFQAPVLMAVHAQEMLPQWPTS